MPAMIPNAACAKDGMSITVTNPVHLAEPVTVVGVYFKDEDREFVETPCDLEAASLHLTVE